MSPLQILPPILPESPPVNLLVTLLVYLPESLQVSLQESLHVNHPENQLDCPQASRAVSPAVCRRVNPVVFLPVPQRAILQVPPPEGQRTNRQVGRPIFHLRNLQVCPLAILQTTRQDIQPESQRECPQESPRGSQLGNPLASLADNLPVGLLGNQQVNPLSSLRQSLL